MNAYIIWIYDIKPSFKQAEILILSIVVRFAGLALVWMKIRFSNNSPKCSQLIHYLNK